MGQADPSEAAYDPVALEEIALTGELIAVANAAPGRVPPEQVDAVLAARAAPVGAPDPSRGSARPRGE